VKHERQAAPFEQTISVSKIVAITVVEGEADKVLILPAFESFEGFIEADHVEARFANLIEYGVDEFRGHFEDAVRRERPGFGRLRANVMQGEDQPDPLGVRRQQPVGLRPRRN